MSQSLDPLQTRWDHDQCQFILSELFSCFIKIVCTFRYLEVGGISPTLSPTPHTFLLQGHYQVACYNKKKSHTNFYQTLSIYH